MMLAVFDNQQQTSPLFETPLKVALIGFDQRIQQTLEIAFRNIGSNCALIVAMDCAQTVIFNFDTPDGRNSFLTFRKEHPGFPIIVISSSEIALRGAYVLTKPLRVAKFIEIFNTIQTKLASKSRTNETKNPAMINSGFSPQETTQQAETVQSEKVLTDKVLTDKVQMEIVQTEKVQTEKVQTEKTQTDKVQPLNPIRNIGPETEPHAGRGQTQSQKPKDNITTQSQYENFYAPEKHLQSVLHAAYKEALDKKTVIEISLKVKNDWGSITIFPGLHKVATDFDEQQIRYMCGTPLYCFEIKHIRYDERKTKAMELTRRDDQQLISSEAFYWQVALWTSDGRLPEGIDLNTPYQLRRWPNFTRLKAIPHSFSMAALLSQKPIDLKLFLKVANISVEHIYSFFSCVYALDLLDTAAGHASHDDLLHGAAQKHPTRGLFERIIDKLKLR